MSLNELMETTQATRRTSDRGSGLRVAGWRPLALVLTLVLGAGLLAAGPLQAGILGPKGGSKEEKRANVRRQRDEMLAELFAARPEMKEKLPKAAGYATFKMTDVNLFLLASGNGYGMLVNNGSRQETFMRVGSLGGGVGMGVKDMRVVFVFHDPKVMQQLLEQGWQFGGKADASAKYKETGVSAEQAVKANVDFKEGTVVAGAATDARAGTKGSGGEQAAAGIGGAMEVFQFTESGVSLQATVAGTKYWKDSELN